MILAYAVIIFIVLALLLRRDLSAIGRIPFRGGWKLAAAVAGLFVLQAALILYAAGQTVLQAAFLILTHIALLFLLVLNRHIPGARLFILGIVLNTLVMVANNGWMPITSDMYHYVHPDRSVETYAKLPNSKNIVLPRDETRLWILTDIIPAPLPWRRYAVSLGDIFLVMGAAQFILLIGYKEVGGAQKTKTNKVLEGEFR
jgi:hypothetical protein